MFASILGTFVSIGILFIIFIFIVIGIASGLPSASSKNSSISDNSVLHLQFNTSIPDRTSNNPIDNINFTTLEVSSTLGLNTILENIRKAKKDPRIKGIFLDLESINAGMASVEEIRNALMDFKQSNKWILSYSEIYTQKTYYLASVANKVYLNPAGIIEVRGFANQVMFYKNALEKLDVDVQIIRHGKFKSAVEPFMLDKMSDSNREQLQKLVNSMWESWLTKVTDGRKISIDSINNIADNLLVRDAKSAEKYGLVDKLTYRDELITILKEYLEIEEKTSINYISLNKYNNVPSSEITNSANKIAVIYASGSIESGKSDQGSMGSETVSKAIRKARLDKNVKAIVLRVNSPGGSALASDIMWREVELAKKAKPVVASMGNVAASGGYYISCAADKIVASEKTITGSIGVFGIVPNFQGFLNNKIGITFDGVKTNKHSDIVTVYRPLTNDERAILQAGVEKVYDDFITKVATGRNMTKEAVDKVGQGRVWLGSDAIKIGLVDEIGGLNKAIEIAKELAELDDYSIKSYPEEELDPLIQVFTSIATDIKSDIAEEQLGDTYKYYQQVQKITNQSGIMTRMPFEIDVY